MMVGSRGHWHCYAILAVALVGEHGCGGNYYDLTCGQDDVPDCTCRVNGTVTRTLGADADCPSFTLSQECGFPPL